MTDDIIQLLKIEYRTDDAGNQLEIVTPRQVFCGVKSVGRSEFYQAAQNELHPELVFVLANYQDYLGETALLHTDWTGKTTRYSIIRTYRNGDSIELTAEARIGNEVPDGVCYG